MNMDEVLRAVQRLESSKDVEPPISEQDMEHLERELGLQLRVNRAEFEALDTLQTRRHKLLILLGALVVLEAFAIGYLFWNHEVSSTMSRYVLLPLSVLVAFFIAFVSQGVWVSASLRVEVDSAIQLQFSAIERTMERIDISEESSKGREVSRSRG
jgi:hypothetical protein